HHVTVYCFFMYCSSDSRGLHSFPTRRSSDLGHRGDAPFILHEDGLGWMYVPKDLQDGPFPTHFEPLESPVRNSLYSRDTNPVVRSEEHTSELQSLAYLVCRLLLEKKKSP